ncbi:transposase [Cryptosporangium minutisporangium]|uniref:transposase n=1 Tax=Cryptosporangium minutisporangium TaxID=113569 RepID=UPI0035EA9BA9
MVNKQYPEQFKVDAVALYRSRPGAAIARVAKDLGINHETLRNWIRQDDRARSGAQDSPTAGRNRPAEQGGSVAEQENAALRRRIRELEEERDILRKAARYFAGETRW